MQQFKPIPEQEFLTFNDKDLVIIDKVQDLPRNSTYYSEYVLIMICTAGKVQLTYDSQSITVHKDEMFFGVPGTVLSDYMLSPDFDCKLLAVKASVTTTTRETQSQILNSALYIKGHPVTKLPETDLVSIFSYYNLICNRLQQAHLRFHNGEVRALLNAFLLYVTGVMGREMENLNETATLRGEQLAEKFLWLVNENYGCNRFVEYYAEQLHITPKYLSTLVRASLGRTPSEVIKAVTMKEIERRLRYTSDSIKQISAAMNFPNTSFFGKYFKQHSGLTPNGYRKKYCT